MCTAEAPHATRVFLTLGQWLTTLLEVSYQISCLSDIYIMIHDSSKNYIIVSVKFEIKKIFSVLELGSGMFHKLCMLQA